MPQPTRRQFLAASAATAMAAPGFARANSRAESCILLQLIGGPSQLDTFDPKPCAPSDIRGPFSPIATSVPGIHLSELFPRTAARMNRIALIRTMHHTDSPIHENGLQLLNTGVRFGSGVPAEWIGHTIARHLHGPAAVMPGTPIDCGIPVSLGLPSNPAARTGPFPDLCDAAYDAVCRGHRFVTVPMFDTVFHRITWDCHADGGALDSTLDDYRSTVAPAFDLGFSRLISRLEQSGRLDRTLVVATGEFGRTPRLNANGGRDHWPGCWTALVAGGGVRGGQVIGRSDSIAGEPADRPVHVRELVASIFHAMGVPGQIDARPVTELF